MIDVAAFRRAYRDAVPAVMAFVTPERQLVLARHNPGLHPDGFDLGAYLVASEARYVRAVELANRHMTAAPGEHGVLDVGGFLGAFPLALRRMGLPVTLVEEYGYYAGAFDELRDFLGGEDIAIWGADFTQPEVVDGRRFALVTNMAMIEHLAHSARALMDNLRTALAPDGRLILETPNIAFWPKRLAFLRGRSVHPPLASVLAADPPFLGHHREYTAADLDELLRATGFAVDETTTFDYTPMGRIGGLVSRAWPSAREVLMACAGSAAGSARALR